MIKQKRDIKMSYNILRKQFYCIYNRYYVNYIDQK